MKMSDEKKKDVLIKSFDLLKNDYENNQVELREIVINMFNIDQNLATDMWKYLLQKYENEIKKERSGITGGIYIAIKGNIGDESAANVVLNDPLIKKSLFEYSAEVSTVCSMIWGKIKENNLEVANELLGLIYNNSYRDLTWFGVLQWLTFNRYHENISEEAYELLEMWGEKIDNKTERAKFSVIMMRFC